MKETDIIALQKNSNGKNMYLVKVGMFYHAYDSAAFAIARLMHYKVKRKHRRNGDVLVAGFPIPQLENIIKKIVEAGGMMAEKNDDYIVFSGIDSSPDDSLVVDDVQKQTSNTKFVDTPLREAIRSYDLMNSSPMNAMNFISILKAMIEK